MNCIQLSFLDFSMKGEFFVTEDKTPKQTKMLHVRGKAVQFFHVVYKGVIKMRRIEVLLKNIS